MKRPRHDPRRYDPPLHAAVGRCDFEAVKRLLAEGHDPDQRDPHGLTALFHAIAPGTPEMVELLLQAGADPDAKAPDGRDLVTYGLAQTASALEAMEVRRSEAMLTRYRRP